jgi:hypothetical protein
MWRCEQCGHDNKAGRAQCLRCGTLAAGARPDLDVARAQRVVDEAEREAERAPRPGLDLLWALPDDLDIADVYGRAATWALLAVWTVLHLPLGLEDGELCDTFLHRVHLVFHEAGHILFIPFGELMSVAGGSLMQLIMPLICLLAFLLKYRNAFGGAVALWWLGHSLLDLAPYIYDGRKQTLMLLGGVTGRDAPGYHDWNNLLWEFGQLHRAETFGGAARLVAGAIMIGALAWGAALLWRQHKVARHSVI